MTARRLAPSTVLILLLGTIAFAAAPDEATLAAVKQIETKTATVKGFTAGLAMSTGSGTQKRTVKGTISFAIPDKLRMTTPMPIGKGDQTTISDGSVTWVLLPAFNTTAKVDMVKVRAAMKDLDVPDQTQQHNIARPLALFKPGTVRVTGIAKVGDTECWVLEGTHGAAGLQGLGVKTIRVRAHVATCDGLTRQVAFLDGTDPKKARATIEYKAVTINPQFKPGTFAHTPAKDAPVIDQTEQVIGMLKSLLKKKPPKPPDPK